MGKVYTLTILFYKIDSVFSIYNLYILKVELQY